MRRLWRRIRYALEQKFGAKYHGEYVIGGKFVNGAIIGGKPMACFWTMKRGEVVQCRWYDLASM